jgi:chaperonin cofactor prefoldin
LSRENSLKRRAVEVTVGKIEKLREEIEKLEEEYERANFGNMFDPAKQDKLYRKIKKKKKELKALEDSK